MAKHTRLILLMICAAELATSVMACKMLSRLAGGGLLAGSSHPVLKTAAGELVIAGVEISDRFPPGCSASLGAPEGTKGYILTWPGNPDIELAK